MIGSAISLLANVAGIHSWFSGIRSGRIQEALLLEAKLTRHSVERLSEHIVSIRSIVEVADKTKKNQSFLEDSKTIYDLMSPIQMGLGEDILATAVVLTPEKLQQAMSTDPWEVLAEIRPADRVKRPTNPDMIPIVFSDKSGLYVGWQMKGALPMILGCEYTPDNDLYLPYSFGNFQGSAEERRSMNSQAESSRQSILQPEQRESLATAKQEDLTKPAKELINAQAESATETDVTGTTRKSTLEAIWNSPNFFARTGLSCLQLLGVLIGVPLLILGILSLFTGEFIASIIYSLMTTPIVYFVIRSTRAYALVKMIRSGEVG